MEEAHHRAAQAEEDARARVAQEESEARDATRRESRELTETLADRLLGGQGEG